MIDAREFASFSRRAGAMILDFIIFAIVGALFHAAMYGGPDVRVLIEGNEFAYQSNSSWLEQLITALVTVGMWMKLKATPGKMLLDCVVVDERTGEPVGFLQGATRYLGYFLSLLPLGLGFLWVIWDKKRQGFHDKLAKTVVLHQVNNFGRDESSKSLQQLMREVR